MANEDWERIIALGTGGYPRDKAIIVDPGTGEPVVIGFVADCEGDQLTLQFRSSGEVEIITEGYHYVSLSAETIAALSRMLKQATAHWKSLDPYWRGETWVGWEALATVPEQD